MNAPFPPVLFEIINAVIWTTALGVVFVTARYMAAEIWAARLNIVVAWRNRDRVAVALFVMATGIAGVRGWTWLGRYLVNTRQDVAWMATPAWVMAPIFFCIVQAFGLLCLGRVLVPDDWGRRGWLYSLSFTALVLLLSYASR